MYNRLFTSSPPKLGTIRWSAGVIETIDTVCGILVENPDIFLSEFTPDNILTKSDKIAKLKIKLQSQIIKEGDTHV